MYFNYWFDQLHLKISLVILRGEGIYFPLPSLKIVFINMLELKQHLKNSEKIDIYILLEKLKDFYSDFYITKSNIRLFCHQNPETLFDLIQKEKIKFILDKEGVILITGFGNKDYRKYIKILAKNTIVANRLLKFVNWNFREEIYAKLKKENFLLQTFYDAGFIFAGGRGREILIRREKIKEKENVTIKSDN